MDLFIYLSMHLKLYFGIVAVGTEQGHTYLLDMRLDDDMEEFDEWNPSKIELVNSDEEYIAACREKSRGKGTHIAIEVEGIRYKANNSFQYKVWPKKTVWPKIVLVQPNI